VTGAAAMTVIVKDQDKNQYTPLLSSVNPSTAFIWTNNNLVFNWTNAGFPFNWTTNQTQYSLMDYDVPITVNKLSMETTLVGIGATILSSEVEYYELPADWGN
jgi:hypothetical protein